MEKSTINKMSAALIEYGMHPSEAIERARNIAQAGMGYEIDATIVKEMIAPSKINRGIPDKKERDLAAIACLSEFILGTSNTKLAAWTGLMMWCGMSPSEASGKMLADCNTNLLRTRTVDRRRV